MDKVTQQNAALMEQVAAAGEAKAPWKAPEARLAASNADEWETI